MKKTEMATILGISNKQLDEIMVLSGEELIKHPSYLALLKGIDRELLEQTLPDARQAYEAGLPAFEMMLKDRYGLENTPMSAYTLGNWVVGALQYPENTDQILHMHRRVPGDVVSNGLGDLVHMLDTLPEQVAAEWQRALCALSLPLMRLS